jgi:hypothetical protein
MRSVSNRTPRAIRVPLPGGKILRLGPLKVGEIASNAVDHPGLQKLVADGTIEILAEEEGGASSLPGGGGAGGPRPAFGGGRSRHRSGDR